MKTQLTIAAAVLTLAACTPKFYPPQVATPESYVYGAGFSSDLMSRRPPRSTLFPRAAVCPGRSR